MNQALAAEVETACIPYRRLVRPAVIWRTVAQVQDPHQEMLFTVHPAPVREIWRTVDRVLEAEIVCIRARLLALAQEIWPTADRALAHRVAT